MIWREEMLSLSNWEILGDFDHQINFVKNHLAFGPSGLGKFAYTDGTEQEVAL
jgi:hypothetical protein